MQTEFALRHIRAIASFTVARLWAISKTAAFLIMLVVLWVTFATAIVLSELGWL
ncbi:hypothetical protein [Scytonema sp. PRP1]|uniref:hypothetical protein n=1 Tax=Scytonema sp. PRP1 TaxID=3120513 RepID=UPI002FD5EA67